MIHGIFLFVVFFAAQNAGAQKAGDVVGFEPITSFTLEQVKALKVQLGVNTPTTSSITAYKLRYYTTALNGQLTVASAGVVVPNDQSLTQRSVVSYQHGTNPKREDAPSRGNRELMVQGAYYASNGYVVVAADYLGLGDDLSFHPYLHAETEASASADALLAIYNLNLTESKKLFLAGYSQGGHATMALHRYWQNLYGTSRPVTAAAPMAGPYDLSGTVVETSKDLNRIATTTVTYVSYLLLSMNMIYDLDDGLINYVLAPYAEMLPGLFDGNLDFLAIAAQLPQSLMGLLTPTLIADIQQRPDANALIAVLKKNDVYDWKPEAPIQFCHGDADLDVLPFNTVKTMIHMKSLGVVVSEAVIPAGLNHMTAVRPCFNETAKFFETFR